MVATGLSYGRRHDKTDVAPLQPDRKDIERRNTCLTSCLRLSLCDGSNIMDKDLLCAGNTTEPKTLPFGGNNSYSKRYARSWSSVLMTRGKFNAAVDGSSPCHVLQVIAVTREA